MLSKFLKLFPLDLRLKSFLTSIIPIAVSGLSLEESLLDVLLEYVYRHRAVRF